MYQEPTPPIVIDDNGDIDVYQDVESVCRELEVYDVGRVSIVDSTGLPLVAKVSDYDVINLIVSDGAKPTPEMLRSRLVDYICRAGPERIGIVDYRDAQLDTLLNALLSVSSATPSHGRGLGAWLVGLQRRIRGR